MEHKVHKSVMLIDKKIVTLRNIKEKDQKNEDLNIGRIW